jgi:hypothetical protein
VAAFSFMFQNAVMKQSLFAILFLLCISCKKESAGGPLPDPGNPNNQVEADILITGKNIHLSSAGNNTSYKILDYSYTRRFLDSVLFIEGLVRTMNGDNDKSLNIYLDNITKKGTYIFGQLDSGQYVEVVSMLGEVYGSRSGTFLTNSDQKSGELIIDSISGKHIQGTFTATCLNLYDSAQVAEITGGRFSMDLE